ncbi:MAG TPA: DUF6498-containing protein [Planctomycetia bacterium]|nr:DUF6498-containing protein [Planctomycetia bacterium]
MTILFRLLAVVAANAVVLYGVGFMGWGGATALAVYWVETVVGSILVALRIWLHRRWTRKRGHFGSSYQVTITDHVRGTVTTKTKTGTFLGEYAILVIAFTLVHGLFLGAILFAFLKQKPDPASTLLGVGLVIACQIAGFLADLPGLKSRPFAWIKKRAQGGLGRVGITHFAIIGGMAYAAWRGSPDSFLIPFAILKLLADVGGAFSDVPQRRTAPAWLVRLMNRVRPGEDFAAHLASEFAEEDAKAAADEAVMPEEKTRT